MLNFFTKVLTVIVLSFYIVGGIILNIFITERVETTFSEHIVTGAAVFVFLLVSEIIVIIVISKALEE